MQQTIHPSTQHPAVIAMRARLESAEARIVELEKRLAKEEADHLGTLGQRDQCYEWADKFADAIAAHFREDIGEHSNLNDPWRNAINLIDGTFCR